MAHEFLHGSVTLRLYGTLCDAFSCRIVLQKKCLPSWNNKKSIPNWNGTDYITHLSNRQTNTHAEQVTSYCMIRRKMKGEVFGRFSLKLNLETKNSKTIHWKIGCWIFNLCSFNIKQANRSIKLRCFEMHIIRLISEQPHLAPKA